METFDSPLAALDFIRDWQPKGKLSCKLIEGVYSKQGVLQEGLYEWYVRF